MVDGPYWRYGPEARDISKILLRQIHTLRNSTATYLDEDFLQKLGVDCEPWELTDTHEFFACMTEKSFSELRPSDPIPPLAIAKFPEDPPPFDVISREACGDSVQFMFSEMHCSKVAVDGYGGIWPHEPGFWVPRLLQRYDDLSFGSRIGPSVPWHVAKAYFTTSDKPHMVYHLVHGDDVGDEVISRAEILVLVQTMKGRMGQSRYCMHIAPILMLSIHGTKARIMIAHFNRKTTKIDIKYNKFEQFAGFQDANPRPHDLEAKRDLFFRWLNPTCQGHTFLEDSKDAPELVYIGPRGRRKLVLRTAVETR